MITIIGMWEPGYTQEQMFLEWRIWKQTIGAFNIDRWLMVGKVFNCGGYEYFKTMKDAIISVDGTKIFLIPTIGESISFKGIKDPVFIFGNINENLKRYIKNDLVMHISTDRKADMFAAACLPLVLYEYRQSNAA